MHIYSTHDDLRHLQYCCITLGAFDGIHKGHQEILKSLIKQAKKWNVTPLVMILDPSPKEVFSKEKVYLLNTLSEKLTLLERYDIRHVYILSFDMHIAILSATQFVEQYFIQPFQPTGIVLGYDHYFGKDKRGDRVLLSTIYGNTLKEIVEVPPYQDKGESIHSSYIKAYIQQQQIEKANYQLGYRYRLEGRVIKGNQIGRTIGFPTANIVIDSKKLIPAHGVYAVKVKARHHCFAGMLNIGMRPTIGGMERVIEVHIIDFNEDIYGEEIAIIFYFFIRNENKFPDIETLKKQLIQDRDTIISRMKKEMS